MTAWVLVMTAERDTANGTGKGQDAPKTPGEWPECRGDSGSCDARRSMSLEEPT